MYVRKTNKMHLHLINLSQLNVPPHVWNKHVHHQEVISVHKACSISYASVGCPAANTIRMTMLAAGHPIYA
jgi:hypothetical protein